MLTFFTLIITVLTINSCERIIIDGKWNDNIKLSAKEIVLSKNQQSLTIKTESTNWWISDIIYKDNIVDLNGIEKTAKNFILNKADFQIERKDDGKTISITMNENNSNSDRILKFELQNGDYFDRIIVTQNK